MVKDTSGTTERMKLAAKITHVQKDMPNVMTMKSALISPKCVMVKEIVWTEQMNKVKLVSSNDQLMKSSFLFQKDRRTFFGKGKFLQFWKDEMKICMKHFE